MAGRHRQLNRCSATQFYKCNHENLNGGGVLRVKRKSGRTMNPRRKGSIVRFSCRSYFLLFAFLLRPINSRQLNR